MRHPFSSMRNASMRIASMRIAFMRIASMRNASFQLPPGERWAVRRVGVTAL